MRPISCCSNDCEKTHCCSHLPNEVENIDRTPDILYTLQWAGRCPRKLLLPLGDPAHPGHNPIHGSLVPPVGTRGVHSPNGTSAHIFRVNTSFGKRALCYKTACMWNDLPAKFKCLKSTNLFKREIKMYLAHHL